MEKLIYKDLAGNKLYKKYIKTRGVWQYFAKNRVGLLVDKIGVDLLMKKARITGIRRYV